MKVLSFIVVEIKYAVWVTFERNMFDNWIEETSRIPAGTRPIELRGGVNNNNKLDSTPLQYGNCRRTKYLAKYFLQSPYSKFTYTYYVYIASIPTIREKNRGVTTCNPCEKPMGVKRTDGCFCWVKGVFTPKKKILYNIFVWNKTTKTKRQMCRKWFRTKPRWWLPIYTRFWRGCTRDWPTLTGYLVFAFLRGGTKEFRIVVLYFYPFI